MTDLKPRPMRLLDKDEILLRMTSLHERFVSSAYLDGIVLVRELTAVEDDMATEAALVPAAVEGAPPTIDTELLNTIHLQMMLVTPGTGEPYADGRRHPLTGDVLIDPRTRTPLLSYEEARAAINGRRGDVSEVLDAGRHLSLILPLDFHSRSATSDGGEFNQRQGTETPEGDAGADVIDQDQPADEPTPHADDDGESEGAGV